jgi:hypothetical protein
MVNRFILLLLLETRAVLPFGMMKVKDRDKRMVLCSYISNERNSSPTISFSSTRDHSVWINIIIGNIIFLSVLSTFKFYAFSNFTHFPFSNFALLPYKSLSFKMKLGAKFFFPTKVYTHIRLLKFGYHSVN